MENGIIKQETKTIYSESGGIKSFKERRLSLTCGGNIRRSFAIKNREVGRVIIMSFRGGCGAAV